MDDEQWTTDNTRSQRPTDKDLQNVYMAALFGSFGTKSLSDGWKLDCNIYGNPNSCRADKLFFLNLYKAPGGHSLMKFKITCVQTLLPLCYMLRIIQNFINFFCRATNPLELYFVNFWTSYSSIRNLYNYFVIISVVVVQNGGFCKKKRLSNFIIILWFATNTYSILYMEKNLIIIWPGIKCLLEGVSFILHTCGFEIYKRVTSPRYKV
jgi:hypothetical protein